MEQHTVSQVEQQRVELNALRQTINELSQDLGAQVAARNVLEHSARAALNKRAAEIETLKAEITDLKLRLVTQAETSACEKLDIQLEIERKHKTQSSADVAKPIFAPVARCFDSYKDAKEAEVARARAHAQAQRAGGMLNKADEE